MPEHDGPTQDPYSAMDLAEDADRLSDRLARVEAKLATLPFKIEASNPDFEEAAPGAEILHFTKLKGRWGLYLFIPDDGGVNGKVSPVEALSIKDKAIASTLVPGLLRAIEQERDARARELREAHDALDLASELLARLEDPPGSRPPPDRGGFGSGEEFDEVPF